MDVILNQVAIWHASGAKELNVKIVPAGRTCRAANNPVYTKTANVTHRYAKDYTAKKTAFCLMVLSDILEPSIVEKQLDSIAKTITEEQAVKISLNSTMTTFEYLPNIITGAK